MNVVQQVEYEATGAASVIDDLTIGSDDVAFHQSLAKNISQLNADVVVGCMGGDEANIYVSAWKEAGWRPRGAFFTCTTWGWPESLGLEGGDGGYMLGAGQWTSSMQYTDDLVGSVESFMQRYHADFPGHDATYDSVASYTSALFAAHQINGLRGRALISILFVPVLSSRSCICD